MRQTSVSDDDPAATFGPLNNYWKPISTSTSLRIPAAMASLSSLALQHRLLAKSTKFPATNPGARLSAIFAPPATQTTEPAGGTPVPLAHFGLAHFIVDFARRILRRRDSRHDRSKAWMIAKTIDIRVVLDPVSDSNAGFDCTLQSIDSVIGFAEQCKITRGIV